MDKHIKKKHKENLKTKQNSRPETFVCTSVSHNCFFPMSQQKLDILTSSLGGCGKSPGKKQRCRHGNYVFSCQVVSQNETDAICDIRKAGAAHSSKDGNCGSQYGMVYWISQCAQAELVLCWVILLCSGVQSTPGFRYISSTHRPYLCRQLKHSCTRFKASTFIKMWSVVHLKFIQAKKF